MELTFTADKKLGVYQIFQGRGYYTDNKDIYSTTGTMLINVSQGDFVMNGKDGNSAIRNITVTAPKGMSLAEAAQLAMTFGKCLGTLTYQFTGTWQDGKFESQGAGRLVKMDSQSRESATTASFVKIDAALGLEVTKADGTEDHTAWNNRKNVRQSALPGRRSKG